MSTELMIPQTEAWQPFALATRDRLELLGTNDSRRVYRIALNVFMEWMAEEQLTPLLLTRSHMIAYRAYLLEEYRSPTTGERIKRATAARMIATVRAVLAEWSLVTRRANPAVGLKPIKVANESTHVALSKRRVHTLLQAIDTSTLIGLRDYALVLLLLRTGLRRAECAALTVGDLLTKDGHKVAIIEHGKEDKQRMVKLLPDVFKAVQVYMEAARRLAAADEEPLFVQIRRGGHVSAQGLGAKGIEHIVKTLAAKIEEDGLTPHGLRATYITRALANGAPLQMVQYSAGHSLPGTTERYDKAKRDLDHNAADYVHDLA